jgi:hypothetical protein
MRFLEISAYCKNGNVVQGRVRFLTKVTNCQRTSQRVEAR